MHNKRRSRANRRLSPDEEARVTKVQQWAARCETRGDFRKLLSLFRATVPYKCLVFGWGYHPDFVLAFWGDDEYPQDYIDFYVQEGVIRHDLVFREWLRTGKCQIWKDVYKRFETEFDRRYARMTKRHGLADTITGGQISGVMASYFAVAMYSDRECRKYFAAFAACVPRPRN